MRITFVMAGGFNLSGGDRVISIYARKLHERGHQVQVVTAGMWQPWQDRVRAALRGDWLRPAKHSNTHFTNAKFPHRSLGKYRPVVDRDLPDADVVVATWWETAEWVQALSPSKGAKVHFIQHYEAFDYTPKDRVDATWRLPMHKITISKWLVDLARDTFGDDDVSLIFNSVDTDQFHAPARSRNDVPTVGMLYNGTPWKGFPLGLEAIERVRKRYPNLRVVTFGHSPLDETYVMPPGSQHTLNPAQSAIKDVYAQCDVWLCASKGEGFHLPPLEAMACRVPVVSTRVGGPIDIIEDGYNGFLAPQGDVGALAARLEQVLDLNPTEWRAMSDHALATALRYTWDDATDLFEAALKQGIERHASGDLRRKRA